MNVELNKEDILKIRLSLLLVLFAGEIIMICLLFFGVITFMSNEDLADAKMQYEVVMKLSSYFMLFTAILFGIILYFTFITGETIFKLQKFTKGITE